MLETQFHGKLLPTHPAFQLLIEQMGEKYQLREVLPDQDPITEIFLGEKEIPLEDFRHEITVDVLGDVSARFQRAMAKVDFTKREKFTNLLINSVTLYHNKAVVKGKIPVIYSDSLIPSN